MSFAVNQTLLQQLKPEDVEVDIVRVEAVEEIEEAGIEEAELNARSGVFWATKTNPRWLWHAIDRNSGHVLAYVFGRRKDEAFLAPQGITRAIWYQEILYRWIGS